MPLRKDVVKYIFSYIQITLRGFNREFSIFFNIEKILFCFIKLCKCAHKCQKIFIFCGKMLGGDAPLHRTSKSMACAAQRISHFLFELRLCNLVHL